MLLYCATTNPGKMHEFRLAAELLGKGRFQVETTAEIENRAAPEETGATFEENAIIKAQYYGSNYGIVFADDSGLEVDALGGEPGVHSARYAGVGASNADNRKKLLERLGEEKNRCARFVCVVAVCDPLSRILTFRGEVEGEILPKEQGTGGFGYDSLFYYPPFKKSFAEISDADKFQVSHRGIALAKMFQYFGERA